MKTAEQIAVSALIAIMARVDGEFDNPHLMEYGPLFPDTPLDCKNIALKALCEIVDRRQSENK